MFNFIARMSLDATGFAVGVKKAEGATNSLLKTISGPLKTAIAGAFGFYGIKAFGQKIIDQMIDIKEKADQLGTSSEEVQRLEKAADKTGISFSRFFTLFPMIDAARENAVKGNEELKKSFQELGVGMSDLNNPAVETIDLMEKIAQKAREGGQSQQFRQAFRDIAGARGMRAIPALAAYAPDSATKFTSQDIEFATSAFKGIYQEASKRTGLLMKIISGDLTSEAGGTGIVEKGAGDSFMERMNQRKAFLNVLFGNYEDKRKQEADQEGQIREKEAELAKKKGETLFREVALEAQKTKSLEDQQRIADEIFKLEFDRLSYAEKRESLQKRIAGWMAIEADQAGTPEADIAKLNRLRAENEMAQLSSPRMENISGNLTELQKIGAQVSESNSAMSILRDQLAVQKQIAANTKPGPTGEGGFE